MVAQPVDNYNNGNQNTNNNNVPHRLFIGGLPKPTTLAELTQMFEQHGVIQHLNLVKDNVDPTQCRGYAFIDFADPKVAENVIQRLNGQQYGGAQLKIQYSNQNARAITTNQNAYAPPLGGIPALGTAVGAYNAEAALAAALAMTHAPPPGPVGLVPQMMNSMMVQNSTAPTTTWTHSAYTQALVPPLGVPTLSAPPPLQSPPTSRVIVLMNMVPLEELDNPSLYAELVQEISGECRKFGTLLSTVVPKEGAGRGKVYLQYELMEHTAVAYRCLKGRKFGPAVVDCMHYPEDKFANGQYE